MDSVKSFKGYGKVNELEEQAFRQKTRMRLLILIVSSIVLVAVVVGAVTGTVIHKRNNSDEPDQVSSSSPSASLRAICTATQYPDSCYRSISATLASNSTDPEEFFKLSLHVALKSLLKLSSLPDEWISKTGEEDAKAALKVCRIVFDDAIEKLNDSISAMDENNEKLLSVLHVEDFKTWLSSAITDQETCLEALQELNSTSLADDFRGKMKNSTEFASNSLAILVKVIGVIEGFDIPISRKLMSTAEIGNDFPEWIRHGDRRLLAETKPKPNVTVALDGSGDVRTIQAALDKVPQKNKSRFVIYVKGGSYKENVNLNKTTWNVMMYGDGKNKTIVSGRLNRVEGVPTFSTATFITVGKNFIAKDMGFMNTAGPAMHQAVALRSGSDQSVFYRCSFDAYQDTLYAHSNRQYYRECDITGTVDFIFGNAAVVFQNCKIQPRQPLPNQFVTITAQGKTDPNQNTGISIQKCSLTPLDNLTVPTYLGRPWKDFSTTVVMQSQIGAFLHPAGWIEWIPNVVPPKTIFYAEYQNTGPGSKLDKRIKWAGFRPTLTPKDASKFTVQSFIQGRQWLPATQVDFDLTL